MQIDRVEVLLVESDPEEARLVQEALRQEKVDARVRVAHDGAEALALLRAPPVEAEPVLPQLLLLDPSLPDADLHRLLGEMQSDPELRRVPVAVVTDDPGSEGAPETWEPGVRCYATRPVDLVQVFHIVESIEDFGLCIVTRGAEE
ncbi:MAG: response regulator [Longimicrobiaceae bacterium]